MLTVHYETCPHIHRSTPARPSRTCES
jgi:hypothetical protein